LIYFVFLFITFTLLLIVFYQWQYLMMFRPKKYRQDKLDDRFTLLDLRAEDGTFLEGVSFTPADFKATIVYFGGNSQDSVGLIYKLSICYENYRILTFNYRGYGNSAGSPSEKNLYADALHVTELFYKHYGNFSVIGYSLGSSLAAFVASRHRVEKLFLLGAFDSIKNLAQTRFPWIPSYLIRYNFMTISYAKELRCDTYLVYSSDDRVVLEQNVLNLKAHLKNLVEYKELSGYNHQELLCCDESIELIKKVLH
jgi:uncharacterized protein